VRVNPFFVKKCASAALNANLSPRERAFVIALAELGPGPHALRNVVFSPRAGMLQFRIPLAEQYISNNREQYETADVLAYRLRLRGRTPG
jgi:hypothetical protein